MGRPKKEQPNHGNLYEIKITTDGKRKSFYSPTSKEDARRQSNDWLVDKEATERAGEIFIDKDVTFAEWASNWLTTYKHGKVKEHTYNYTYRVNVEKYMIPFFDKKWLKT